MLGLATNTVLLHSLAGAKAALALGAWASGGLLSRLRGTLAYPITVRRENGSCTQLTLSGDTTLAQIQGLLHAQDLRARGLDPALDCPTRPLGPAPAIEEIAFTPGPAPESSILQGLWGAVLRPSKLVAC